MSHTYRRSLRGQVGRCLALVLALSFVAGYALAQDDANERDEPPARPPAPAEAAPPSDPLAYRIEIFVVSHVTRDDGTREERYSESTEARPGQTVEYRIFIQNVSDTTLPAGLVQIRLPVPEGTEYVANSATPSSDDLLTEFSADRGLTFSEPPVIIGDDEQRRVAEPSSYDEIRWTFFIELEPGQEEALVYRVIVR